MQSMLDGLPVEARSTSYVDPSSAAVLGGGYSSIGAFIDMLRGYTGGGGEE